MSEFSLGDVKIDCLRDAIAPFAHDSLAYAFPGVTLEQWQPYREPYPDTFVGDNWLVRFCGILVKSGDATVLVDTGLGAKPDPYWKVSEGRLLAELARAGVRPEEVDIVFHSHLHADHVGWNTTADGQPTFPNARYMVHREDWKAFHEPLLENAFPFPYLQEQVFALEQLGVLDLIDGETQITDELKAVPAHGHTPGHMCVEVSSRGQRGMICGDAILHPAQVREPDWPFVFDVDREAAARTRSELIERIESEGMMLIQCHFPEPGHGLIVRRADGRWWEPATELAP
jgi:glyoxylase-like metal-dependent hydrolase (beta-lactamase superfamily II)